ncbi:Pr6Pr family membrane protein [Microbacterium sp. 22242]|uniref:Pr6Pr family membrane protein n=1 Tax=Microbacterium sp. 22242 TaxID=3453896 RepID=UPI003F82746B
MQMPAPERTANRTSRLGISPALWGVVRLAGAALILLAVSTQVTMSVQNALAAATPAARHLPTVIANLLSYFTILSNVAAIVALLLAGVWALRNARSRSVEPRGLAILLACVSTYMITTGIVYNLLLRNAPVGISAPWVNEVLHVVGPLILLADVLFAPQRRCLGWGVLGAVAAFPLVWVAYTLIRANFIIAPLTGEHWWYPYPFLNPHLPGNSALTVVLYVVGIAIVILAVGAGVIAVSRKRGR